MVIGSLTGIYPELGIGKGEGLEKITNLLLAQGGREVIIAFSNEICRHIGVKVIQSADPDTLQHLADIFLCMRKIGKSAHIVIFL